MEDNKTGCWHNRISKIRCKSFAQNRIFLFYCRGCGRTIAKRIIEIKSPTGIGLKELTSVVPSEIIPWKDSIQQTFDVKEVILKGNVVELVTEEPNQNGKS